MHLLSYGGIRFFQTLGEHRGSLIKCDEQSMVKFRLDGARVLIKIDYVEIINDSISAITDYASFSIKLIEDPSLLKGASMISK